MLGQPQPCFIHKIKAGKINVGMFQKIHDPQRLPVMLKAAKGRGKPIQRRLARMAKGTMPKIVRKADRLGERFVKPQHARQRSAYLGNFDTVAESAAVVIVKAGGKDLRFAGKPSECVAVNDPVAVALKGIAIGMRGLRRICARDCSLRYCIVYYRHYINIDNFIHVHFAFNINLDINLRQIMFCTYFF